MTNLTFPHYVNDRIHLNKGKLLSWRERNVLIWLKLEKKVLLPGCVISSILNKIKANRAVH